MFVFLNSDGITEGFHRKMKPPSTSIFGGDPMGANRRKGACKRCEIIIPI